MTLEVLSVMNSGDPNEQYKAKPFEKYETFSSRITDEMTRNTK